MLRAWVAVALVGAAAAGVCSPKGRRVKANENASYAFPGQADTVEQAAGVNVKEFMPSVGNLFYNPVSGSASMYCYAGSPIGYLNADMCCNISNDLELCGSEGFLTPNGNSLVAAIGGIDNLKDDVVVGVKATVCYTPTQRKGANSLQRSAVELVQTKPPAVPYEFTGSGESACDCRNDKLRLHVNKESLRSDNATRWQTHLRRKLQGQPARPNFDKSNAGTCLFYRAGWGFDSTRDIVPLIPTKRLNANGASRVRVNVADATIPFSDNSTADGFELPCGGEFSLESDLNYCFHSIPDDLTARYVSQDQVDVLATFCSTQHGPHFSVNTEFMKAMRCCMKVTVGDNEPIYTIKADLMAAAGCRNVNEAVNNGDGKMHTHPEPEGPLAAPTLWEKHTMGASQIQVGALYYDLNVAPDQFRRVSGVNGFHEVCVFDEDLDATCDAYAANPPILCGDAPCIGGINKLFTMEDTCAIPATTITGKPNDHHLPEYAASLYNMHARNINASYQCKDPGAIAELIQVADNYGDNACARLKKWSQMSPGTYQSVSGVPMPSAQWLADKSSECQFDPAVAKDRSPPVDNLGYGCKTEGAIGDSPYESVDGSNAASNAWHDIANNCGLANQECKFTPQYTYTATTYAHNKDVGSFKVFTDLTSCLKKAETDGDDSVVLSGTNVVFMSAAPRVQGILHPIYEGGGYVGGGFENPGYRYSPGTQSTQAFNDSDSELWVTNADGSGIQLLDVVPPLAGEISSLTGALVIDDECWLNNNMGARENPNTIPIAGRYPRFMDVGKTEFWSTHYKACYTDHANSDQIQMVGSQAFFDIYGRGGGVYDYDHNLPYSDLDQEFVDYATKATYPMFTGAFSLDTSNYICGAFGIEGCIGECDQAAYNRDKALQISKMVIGGVVGAVGVATDGVLTGVVGAAGLASGAGGMGTLNSMPEGSVTVTPFKQKDTWRTFTRAIFNIRSPVARNEVQFVRQAYAGYPSNIAEADPAKEKIRGEFNTWHETARAFPAQPLAVQLGCRSAATNGKFKADMPNLNLQVHREHFTTTDPNSDENVFFALIGKKDLPADLQGDHYYLHKDRKDYTPAREDKWRPCGLCPLYTQVPEFIEDIGSFVTPAIDGCKLSGNHMRYGLNERQNLLNTQLAENFNYTDGDPVTIHFGYGINNGKGGKRMEYDPSNPMSDDSVLVQRLLGRNLSNPGHVLTHPLCTGDASSELGVCTMNKTLHLQWDHAIVCQDRTKSFTSACINPVWANDRQIILPSADGFEPTAERLSYCGAPNPSSMDPENAGLAESFSGTSSMFTTVNDGRDPTFVLCDNDRYNEEERRIFCQGSQTTVPGKYSVMGVRLRARKSVTDVCTIPDGTNTAMGRCVLYPDDPEGWTLTKLADALQDQPQATYVVNLVPVSFRLLERLSYWTTAVETTWFNDPIPPSVPPALVDAYSDANEALSFMAEYNKIDWDTSAELAPDMCQPGGPALLREAHTFGLLWVLVESLRLQNNNFSVAALDGDLAKGESQTVTFREEEVYSGFPDVNARIGTRGLILKSAFGEDTRARAEEIAPARIKSRFSQLRRARFDGVPVDSITTTCTRVYSEGQVQMQDIQFVQDVDGCRNLSSVDRTPLVISGADARNSKLDNVEVVGGPAAVVVRGRDSSIYQDRVAANVDVNNMVLRGFEMPLRWRDGCTDGAVSCANITTIPGISLALARADGNVVVEECPYGNADLWACTATVGRDPPQVLLSTTAGEPMYNTAQSMTPLNCTTECNATSPQCHEGVQYTCTDGVWTGRGSFQPTDVTGTLGHPTEYVDADNPCIVQDNFVPSRFGLNEAPCALYTDAFMSTGALLRGDNETDLAEKVLLYIAKLSSRQRCSTIGCPGHDAVKIDTTVFPLDATGDDVVNTVNVWRCGISTKVYAEDIGFWEWHYTPVNPYAISSVQTLSGKHAELPYAAVFADSSMTSPEVQQGSLRNFEDLCAERNGTGLVFSACSEYAEEQTWLFVRLGSHFRVEVPNNPYLCLFVKSASPGNVSDPVLLPCPPCLYGSSSGEVTMNRYGDFPDLGVRPNLNTNRFISIPISTDPSSDHALKADMETGLCMCYSPLESPVQPSYDCDCNLQGMRRTDVVAQLGADGCKTAAGSLLAACDRLGAGLSAVDGSRPDMVRACAALGTEIGELVGAQDGAGATAKCVDQMLRIVTMGGNYVPGETLTLASDPTVTGLTAITAKVVYQPHSNAMPTAITAPNRMVINATSFLAAFGNDLYRITAEGFSTAGVVWAGVIVELSICFVAVILHVSFAATTPSRVAKAKEKVTVAKKTA